MNKKWKKVQGVGINDADYPITESSWDGVKAKVIWRCPIYLMWANMLGRCYSDAVQKRQPTYKGCTVVDSWLTYSNFYKWAKPIYKLGDALDKDLLEDGNKIYSPETCLLVSRHVNSFILKPQKIPKNKVSTYKNRNDRYIATCNVPAFIDYPATNYIGSFDSEQEANLAWKLKKQEYANVLADLQTDSRLAKIIRRFYA